MSSMGQTLTPVSLGAGRGRGLGRGIVGFVRLMARNKVGFIGFLGVLFFLILSYIVPYFVPISTVTNINDLNLPPSWQHILGTDSEGRDILKQIIHGGSAVIDIGLLTAGLTTLIAVSLGALTAFVGGWFDTLMMGLTDVVLTIPQFPLLAVLATLISLTNIFYVAILLALLSWPYLLRAIRAQVLSLKERDYVEAARSLDLSTPYILFREILPNMLPFIAISFTLAATGAIYAESGLFFLGLIPLTGNNWGVMIYLAWNRGAANDPSTLSYVLSPVMAISLFQLAMVFMSRSLEEVFNPRLRQGV